MTLSNIYLETLRPSELLWIAGMRSIRDGVKTGHDTFDKAANHPSTGYVGIGNVSSPVQRSSYVRAFFRTRSNGVNFPIGELQTHDLHPFISTVPSNVLDMVKEAARERDVILYEFRSPAAKRSVVQGWILTDEFHRHLFSASVNRQKALEVIGRVKPFVCWKDDKMKDPVPAELILDAVSGMKVDEARDFIEGLGYLFATDSAEFAQSGLSRDAEKPFAAWLVSDPSATLVRSGDPAVTSAMVAIRERLTPEAVVMRRASQPENIEDEDPAPW